jgi:hypothetical protein
MRNPLTFRVESSLGAVFISLLSLFFIGILFISMKNLDSDLSVLTSTTSEVKVRNIAQSEVILIQEWVAVNKIVIPEGSGYRYLLRKYPSRPWLDTN